MPCRQFLAPGPDGSQVAFFQKFWPQLQLVLMRMLHKFFILTLDMARWNFGLISLIP